MFVGYNKFMLGRFKNITSIGISFTVSVLLAYRGAAQPTPIAGGPGDCFPDPCIPIDQGTVFISAVGAIFAYYFLRRKFNPIVSG